jgi:hypothetical protein
MVLPTVPVLVGAVAEQTTSNTGATATYELLPVFGSGGVPESVMVAVFG